MENINLNEYLHIIYDLLAYLATSFAIFFIGKMAYSFFNPKINVKDELVEHDNLAFAIAHIGYFVGLIIVIGSVIVGPTKGIPTDVMEISIYGILSIILLNISSKINDKIIFNKFPLYQEIIRDRNVGAGAIEASNMIASGLIIAGAMKGETETLLGGIISVLIYWLVGQVIMLIASKVYNAILPYDIHEHIEKDNVAVGVGYSGANIGIAILVGFSISHMFETPMEAVADILFHLILGFLLLPVLRFITDKVLLPGQKITDEIINQENPNVGAGVIEAFSYIGGTLLLTWCL